MIEEKMSEHILKRYIEDIYNEYHGLIRIIVPLEKYLKSGSIKYIDSRYQLEFVKYLSSEELKEITNDDIYEYVSRYVSKLSDAKTK